MHIKSTPLEAAMAADARPQEWPPGEAELAHRIRTFDWASTPLGPIDTWPQSLRTSIRQMLSSHAAGDSTLASSRPDAVRAEISYQATDLAALTSGLANNFRFACECAGLLLVVDCPPLPAPVYVDRDMWEKIVLNLISNAFKFTFEGVLAISQSVRDGQVELSVVDTGVGVPDHELPRMFERFHRIEGQRARSHEGSGIGLALVRELVELHGGTISVQSEVGCGTSFSVRLPFGKAHLPPDRIGASRTLASTFVTARAYVQEALHWLPDAARFSEGSGAFDPRANNVGTDVARILLADDNSDMRAFIRRLLETRCRVQIVTDGEAALTAIHEQRPDLVLADVTMPRLDGFGLLRAIRSHPDLRDIPVILLSARADEESRVEGLRAGADDYLFKPFLARELVARVSAHLGLSRVRRDTTRALRESEQRLRTALRAGKMAYWTWNSAEQVLLASDTMAELIGLLPDQHLRGGRDGFAIVHPEDRKRHRELVERRVETGKGWHSVVRIIRPRDGQVIWVEERAEVSHDPKTNKVRITGLVWDITEQKQTAERQKILLAELQHRTRNLLGVVRSITNRTLDQSDSLQEFGASFRERLEALARVNGLLSRLNEGERITFSELIRTELSGLGITETLGHAGQVSLHGPENVRLRSSTVQTLALGLHELATNALKYGALSRPEGRLSIRWSVKRPSTGDRRLQVEWREEGISVELGPDDEPVRKGYGRELIERALPYQLQAETSYAITREGVRCVISLPLSTTPEDIAHA